MPQVTHMAANRTSPRRVTATSNLTAAEGLPYSLLEMRTHGSLECLEVIVGVVELGERDDEALGDSDRGPVCAHHGHHRRRGGRRRASQQRQSADAVLAKQTERTDHRGG